jgi:hypothetical protein
MSNLSGWTINANWHAHNAIGLKQVYLALCGFGDIASRMITQSLSPSRTPDPWEIATSGFPCLIRSL